MFFYCCLDLKLKHHSHGAEVLQPRKLRLLEVGREKVANRRRLRLVLSCFDFCRDALVVSLCCPFLSPCSDLSGVAGLCYLVVAFVVVLRLFSLDLAFVVLSACVIALLPLGVVSFVVVLSAFVVVFFGFC